MTWIDWTIVGLYVATAIGIGAWFTRKASKGTSDFFVAGRSLGWFVAGTSIVATTFAADTPVFVAGMTRTTGISANWFWWSVLIGQVATATIFARLWRRTEVLTDVEFVKFRYGTGSITTALRIFKSFFQGIGVNCVVMAAVTLAMVKITTVLLGIEPEHTWIVLLVLASVGLLYSAMSGLYGVVYTDIVQFCLAMAGSIGLAVIAYIDASSGEGMMAKLTNATEFKPELLHFFPRFDEVSWPLFTFVIYIMMLWWASAPGKGYSVQRLLATKSERDAKLAFLWYAFLHYVLRPWPWIVVGLLSLIYFPTVEDAETVFPLMIDHFLPVGLKGIMVAAMLAAFMSTIDTHLNWGASYIVNDVYEPYINPNASPRHYVWTARFAMVFIMIAAIIATTLISSILGAFMFLGVFFAGIGTVMIARWFWWRVNAFTELVAIIATIIIASATLILIPDITLEDETINKFGLRVLITTFAVMAIWIPVAFLTEKEPSEAAITFHEKMRIGGIGWNNISKIPAEVTTGLYEWVLVMALLLCILLGTGKLLFHEWLTGGILIGFAVLLFIPFLSILKRARNS
ncbi:MAG TPA: sodium:proline symporter [Phycisphaerales bacterium]|nr:sodium:proline symporter [Phycisphaerales bacterium]HIB01337.1 sodium:proline symporter [Phycisphaerales bacterium]HIB49730.1 sodium:proline symporter [Phycisphaerales bacterium]HIN84273.1 sodium:proline symporter [Phycisphaerales bacterium]HIO20662.1 sodium:proline symporter [Phycisphaerales bacterium]